MNFISHEFFSFLLFFLLAIFLIAGYPVALTLAGTAIFVAILGCVTASAANISVSTIPSGKPPTEIPVTVPDPLIAIGITIR